MAGYAPDRRARIAGATGAALLVAAVGLGLIAGLGGTLRQRIAEDLTVVAVLPERPPPPARKPAPRPAQKRRAGAAAPPSLTAHATPLIAPPLVLRPPEPPPLVVAAVAGAASEASQGAAPVIGPGTGSGGLGNGTGSGAGGDGDGGGGGGGEIPLRLLHGKLRYQDLPRALVDARAHGTVAMHFVVDAKGRVVECRITQSSGNRELDHATCDLIRATLRYRPTRDARGRARADYVDGEQEWTIERPE